jgi:sporulation protein YlmC with PRC-barrel domain
MVHTLVPSDRVEAASVYGRDGDKIGTIERLMLEKTTGMVAYAVVKWGGFLGTGQHHYPVPWSSLKYNLARRAYETQRRVNCTLIRLACLRVHMRVSVFTSRARKKLPCVCRKLRPLDLLRESLNVGHGGRADLPVLELGFFTLQVQEPT